MFNPTATELAKQADFDFLLAMKDNPAVIAQLQVWHMLKQTADWPPESLLHMKQIAETAHYCLGKMCPHMESVVFVQEEGDEEEGE